MIHVLLELMFFSHPETRLKMMLLKVTCHPCVTFQALFWVIEGDRGVMWAVLLTSGLFTGLNMTLNYQPTRMHMLTL